MALRLQFLCWLWSLLQYCCYYCYCCWWLFWHSVPVKSVILVANWRSVEFAMEIMNVDKNWQLWNLVELQAIDLQQKFAVLAYSWVIQLGRSIGQHTNWLLQAVELQRPPPMMTVITANYDLIHPDSCWPKCSPNLFEEKNEEIKDEYSIEINFFVFIDVQFRQVHRVYNVKLV